MGQRAALFHGVLATQNPSKEDGAQWITAQPLHVQGSELWLPQLVAAQEIAPAEVAPSRAAADVAVQNSVQAQRYSARRFPGPRVAETVAIAAQIRPEWR